MEQRKSRRIGANEFTRGYLRESRDQEECGTRMLGNGKQFYHHQVWSVEQQ